VGLIVASEFWESGHLIFKTVGGDMKLQKMCRILFFAFSLMTFDAQIMSSCLVLVAKHGLTGITQEEAFILTVGFIFVGLWSLIGYFAVSGRFYNL